MVKRLGIYIHIPFCASKCSYCDFYSLAGCDHLMPAYHEALLKHIRESSLALGNYEIDSIYFGGGTPSFYGADRIADILDELKLNGNVRTDSEITVECNPDSISLNALKLLRREGVNRISLGVQEANNDLLKLIGRRHDFQQAKKAVENARLAGFDNISIDLMYGLPSQSKTDWALALSKIIELHPEHISCYGLKLEEGTPMYENYRNSPLLPDDDEQADMYSYCVDLLARYNYKQYEISNFAVPGFESRHNLKYWMLDDYMGFGPGAASCIGSLRYSYVKDIRRYITGVNRGSSLIEESQNIDPLEKAVEYVMLGMRTVHGISEIDYRTKCQCEWKPVLRALIAFRKRGWAVCEEDGRWHFTVSGFLISNALIGLMLEAQAGELIDEPSWLKTACEAEEKYTMSGSEEDMFADYYKASEKEPGPEEGRAE